MARGAEPKNPRHNKRPAKRERSGRQAHFVKISLSLKLLQYFKSNLNSVGASLKRQFHQPLSSLLTCSAIGIAITFPAFFYVALENFERAREQLPRIQISVFTKKQVTVNQARQTARNIARHKLVKSTRVLTPSMALAEYSKLLGSKQPLKLSHNPLPAIIIIQLHDNISDTSKINHLARSLKKYGRIQSIHLDKTMVERLYKLIEIGNRGVLVVALLLAFGVILIVGNTIRLDIQNRKDEIIVTKLIGASNGFIRRPFLYSGFWYGTFGGLIAITFTTGLIAIFSGPIAEFTQLSGDAFQLESLTAKNVISLIGISALLGLLGSWLSVARHLHEIEPT